jgi:hypothetical protein
MMRVVHYAPLGNTEARSSAKNKNKHKHKFHILSILFPINFILPQTNLDGTGRGHLTRERLVLTSGNQVRTEYPYIVCTLPAQHGAAPPVGDPSPARARDARTGPTEQSGRRYDVMTGAVPQVYSIWGLSAALSAGSVSSSSVGYMRIWSVPRQRSPGWVR